ncbi:MAG TPA: hypothetical protein VHL80_05030 [Polyangia bacterium]|nr:hypothetical protein [Polyangia bacterium]
MGGSWSSACRVALLLGVAGALGACQGPPAGGDEGGGEVGAARVALVNVPPDVTCIRVFATGATRFAFADADVTTGQSSTLDMEGIPVGDVVFTGFGLEGVCAATADDDPTWVSDRVTATIVGGRFTNVDLPMHPNGRAFVSVDFQSDDPPAPDAGAPGGEGSPDAGADCRH